MGTLQDVPSPETPAPTREVSEIRRLRDLSPQQRKSGLAAWLGWLFDGLDMHLYVLVATPFVAELLGKSDNLKDPAVGHFSSWIQASFMFGWALGGGFFGRIADRLGRSRALSLTILTYALFTGLSYFAQTWWQLLILRFLAALGIGGEWAVGASLLSETWPKRWRPWIAAVLQTGVNLGVLLAAAAYWLISDASLPNRTVFLVGVLPAFMVLWIRWAVPEPEEWRSAKSSVSGPQPRFIDLFRGPMRRVSVLTLLVCALSLTGHWAFLFWNLQYVRGLDEVVRLSDDEKNKLVSIAMFVTVFASIAGNFLAAALARYWGYRRAIVTICLAYALSMFATYATRLPLASLWVGIVAIGLCQGVFGLFTMYLPPLFPTLLRTTGAGFCYNFGRIAAGFGIVFFGLFTNVGDHRLALFYAGSLFIPAAVIAMLLPEPPDEH